MKNILLLCVFSALGYWLLKPTPEPPPVIRPQTYFPTITTTRGHVLKAVTLERRDIDGFVVQTQSRVCKLFNVDLDQKTLALFCNALPSVNPRPTPLPTKLNEPTKDAGGFGWRWYNHSVAN